jgi:hypothetical protein
MNKFNREHRRAQRERKIQHAFNIYWNTICDNTCGHGYRDDVYDFWKSQHDLVLLETEEARRQHQDNYRQEVLILAKRVAKHLCVCSCWACGNNGYKKYEKTRNNQRAAEQDKWTWTHLDSFE